MILTNKSLAGQNTGVSIAALKEASDFYRTRLADIKVKQLAIAKKIVEQHRGTITVTSNEEKGSTFIVKLPLLKK